MSKSFKKKRWDYDDNYEVDRRKENAESRRKSKRMKNALKSKNIEDYLHSNEEQN